MDRVGGRRIVERVFVCCDCPIGVEPGPMESNAVAMERVQDGPGSDPDPGSLIGTRDPSRVGPAATDERQDTHQEPENCEWGFEGRSHCVEPYTIESPVLPTDSNGNRKQLFDLARLPNRRS